MSIPLKIYTGQTEPAQKPRPQIRLDPAMGRTIAVNELGEFQANLWDYERCFGHAEEKLAELGYDTSWAIWDENGAFAGWAE